MSGGMEGLCGGNFADAHVCRSGRFPLYAASLGGHLSCVEALIRSKADVLQFDK